MILSATPDAIGEAARAIVRGELVGMPTETVYGIAANVFDENAVRATFRLKNRPADNPLIVHLARTQQWSLVATVFSADAERLAAHFWPGPLSLVLPKQASVPTVATGGLDTVAIRVPDHPTARQLILEAGTPLTAPSANSFMSLSPTRAQDIETAIATGLSCILDGGSCLVGIESTVVDMTGAEPILLRPGGVSRLAIERILGRPILTTRGGERRSPGMYDRHYAPVAPIRLVERLGPLDCGISFRAPLNASQARLPNDAIGYAKELYKSLHDLDRLNPREIAVELLPDSDEWEAVRDRILRATSRK